MNKTQLLEKNIRALVKDGKTLDLEYFVILDEHLNAEQYGVGFKKGNTELRDQINESLKELKKNGKFDELAKKYELSDMVCLAQ